MKMAKYCTQCKKPHSSKKRLVCYKCQRINREKAVITATPKWLSTQHKEEIDLLFNLAKEMRQFYADTPVVDHIVPLRGKDVCGLNVPWNMQILPMSDNRAKGNRVNRF